VALAALAGGLVAGAGLARRPLREAARTLAAVRDGVRGFRDGDFSLFLARGRDPDLGELVALFNEVGDTLRSERAALFGKEVLLDTVLQATPTGLVLTDERQRVLFANRAARELFAVNGRFEGQDFAALLAGCPPGLREPLVAGRDALFTDRRPGEDAGEEETYHLARRRFDLAGRRHHLYLLRRLTGELRRQEVAVWKKAIRAMSHELNNSLAPIASLAASARHLAARERLAAPGLDNALEVIEERARHLKTFLEGYARFARLPEPARREVHWELFLSELREIYPFTLAGELPGRPGWFDPGQLEQALINLLKNAHESGSPAPEVTVAVQPTADGGVRLEVADRGGGMSEEVMRRALLPFWSSKPEGSGMGLPLAREIVEAHGGRLRLERRDGGGTAVTCWLPAE
jgi:nitrogen fixation/metabolism regulation signal transduction histidine kinase